MALVCKKDGDIHAKRIIVAHKSTTGRKKQFYDNTLILTRVEIK